MHRPLSVECRYIPDGHFPTPRISSIDLCKDGLRHGGLLVIERFDYVDILPAEETFALTGAECLCVQHVVFFGVGPQVCVLCLSTHNAFPVGIGHQASGMPLAHIVGSVPSKTMMQPLVPFAAFLHLVESHGLPLGAVVTSVPGLRVLTKLERLYHCSLVVLLMTFLVTQAGMRGSRQRQTVRKLHI